jgi:cytochrome c biogenesis protein CcdA
MNKLGLTFLFLIIISSFSFASIDVIEYYGEGCPHCVRTAETLINLTSEYNLSLQGKEVYFVPQNNQEMLNLYIRFGIDPSKGGVPTTIVDNKTLVIGEVSKDRWREIFNYCENEGCKEGVFTQTTYLPITERDVSAELTLTVLIGAAIVDSINPCTIAVMVILLGVILSSKGRKDTLLAGIAFAFTVFIMYLLMGLGILQAISSTELQSAFYIVVTFAALILAILELRAYFRYRPGMLAIEMPMFLRPYTKKVMQGATSIPGVIVAAAACSLFLLPCSSGPYLMVLAMLAKSVSLQSIAYLVAYNLIFILPMILITLMIYLGKANAEDVHELKERYIREIHLISGLILLALFLMMAGQLFHLW